ncbi:MAG: accessory factor UbiK family protein [Gammaproteobacteria bacterium]|nr:accessory factor UbiK family protein [Gammaproteobacteria bacterium]
MIEPKNIDELTQKLISSLPEGISELQRDAKRNMQQILQSYLNKMNLVSREEFEVQSAVLARTRSKLEALEKQVAELEKQLAVDP